MRPNGIVFDAWVLETLKKLQAIDPLAHIAGGYLRDLDNGRAVKDLDIFLSTLNVADVHTAVRDTHPMAGGSVGEQYAISDSKVAAAISYKSEAGLPDLNVIILTHRLSMEENVKRFDFGICRIAFDGESFEKHWSYESDRMNELFVIRRCLGPQQLLLSLTRWKRLEQKYVGWDLVVPSTFSEFAPAVRVSNVGVVEPVEDAEDFFA